jgi:hypothetical protein
MFIVWMSLMALFFATQSGASGYEDWEFKEVGGPPRKMLVLPLLESDELFLCGPPYTKIGPLVKDKDIHIECAKIREPKKGEYLECTIIDPDEGYIVCPKSV